MTERWERELKKLGDVGPSAELRSRVDEGPHGGDQPPTPGGRQRVVAGVVAFAVFIAAGSLAWNAFRPSGGSSAASGADTPTLEINLSKTGSASVSTGDPTGGAAAFSADLQFGDLHSAVTPQTFGVQPLTTTKTGPAASPPGYFVIKPWLTAGSEVTFQTDAADYLATISSADSVNNVSTTMSDTGHLPTKPGIYNIAIHATWPDGFAEWYLQVGLVAPGMMQLWEPDIASGGASSTPNVDLVVDGRLLTPGVTDALDGGVPQSYPPIETALEVHQGAPLGIDPSATRGLSNLSWVESLPPHAKLGTVDLSVDRPSFDAPPGTYYFTVNIQTPEFTGDLVYPITVIAASPPIPTPSLVVPTVHLDFNTTSGTPDCPGSPEATITYGDQSTKAALTSFTWTCPGSSMNADTVRPSFSDADFVRVPTGAELVISGDLTAAVGNLQSSPGDYPWTTLHDLGDLGGGVSLSFDPGRYVIEVIAHWPNGALHFYFPIELEPDQPVSTTPLPSLIPDVLKVNCDGGAPSTLDPTVAVQVDGLHVRMVGQAPPGEQIALFGPNGDLMQTAQSADASSGQFFEFTSSGGPGTYFVKCYPIGSNVDPATINSASTVKVVDPNGYWVSTVLGCAPDLSPSAAGVYSEQEAAVRALEGVQASDTVEPAGYSQDPANTTWRIVRGGEVIGIADVFGSPGAWEASLTNPLQHNGLHCLNSGSVSSAISATPSP